ncbi:MAG TPA: formyltetrahydrofolate deformylase [Actinomycetaceae bacterium]|nr:formyltetrahydrofolate deformylase [Actinomycetaceae bacterium]
MTPPELVLTLSCPDRRGIVHAVAGAIVNAGGNITESRQYGDPDAGRFLMRVQTAEVSEPERLRTSLTGLAARFEMDWNLDVVGRPKRTLILASKQGHCLSDILFRTHDGRMPLDVVGVVSNHEVLRPIADFYRTPFHHVPVTPASKQAAEAELLRMVAEHDIELVVLARYMQVLSDEVCRVLRGRAINIHHSFLPSFKGARPYAQAHTRGVKLIGATAHYVTADLDEGPIIEQDVVRVTHADSAEELVALGQDVERQVLARAVRWHAEHRVLPDGSKTVVFA